MELDQKIFAVFAKFREHLFGSDWVSSGRKYALAAAMLDLVPPENYAPSVKRMLEEKEKRTNLSHGEMKSCLAKMGQLSSVPAPR